MDKVAVKEPPLSEHGSIPTSWIPRFDREVALGKPAAALVTFVKADNLVPTYLPRWLLVPLIALYFGWEKRTVRPPDVPIRRCLRSWSAAPSFRGLCLMYIPEASAFRTAQLERAATKEEGIPFSRSA